MQAVSPSIAGLACSPIFGDVAFHRSGADASHRGIPGAWNANIDETGCLKPAFNFSGRVDSVKARRIAVKSVEDIIFQPETLIAERKDAVNGLDEQTIKSFLGKRDKPAAPFVEHAIRDAGSKGNPLFARHKVPFCRVNPDGDDASMSKVWNQPVKVFLRVWRVV